MSALLQQRRAIRGPAAFVDEDLWLVDPTLLIAVKPPDPVVLAVNQPAFSHDLAVSTSVLVEVSWASQVVIYVSRRSKKEQAPESTPSVTHGMRHCFRVASIKTLEV